MQNKMFRFFDEIDRITESDYQPTMQDILNVRSATIGVQEMHFWNKNTQFRYIVNCDLYRKV